MLFVQEALELVSGLLSRANEAIQKYHLIEGYNVSQCFLSSYVCSKIKQYVEMY